MSYQGQSGDLEIRVLSEPLVTSAALYLGLLMFGFSRLDLSLERYLDMAAPPATPAGKGHTMRRLIAFVDRLDDPALRAGFRHWMARVHRLEGLRKAIASGHWLPDPRSDRLLHDAGTSSGPVEYRLRDLEWALASVRELQSRLQMLCATERGLGLAAAEAFLTTQPIQPLARALASSDDAVTQ